MLLSKINSDIHKIRETAVLNDENADFNISKTNYQLDYTIEYYTGSLLNNVYYPNCQLMICQTLTL